MRLTTKVAPFTMMVLTKMLMTFVWGATAFSPMDLRTPSVGFRRNLVLSPPRPAFHPMQTSTQLDRNSHGWDGDDLRWFSKIQRRMQRARAQGSQQPVKTTLIGLNILAFAYQTIDTLLTLRRRFPSYWRSDWPQMIWYTVWGSSAVNGPFTWKWIFLPMAKEPHRYLTSGFLHGGLIHIYCNLSSLQGMPAWLETGLGRGCYLTAYLFSIIVGTLCHEYVNAGTSTAALGASGGIMGLYGLMYVCLVRMGNSRSASMVLRGMSWVILCGLVISSVSNAGHVGGFLGGALFAILFGPRYQDSYALRRKNSLEVDLSPADYRSAMGYGKRANRGLLPLSAFWILSGAIMLTRKSLRNAPLRAIQGLLP